MSKGGVSSLLLYGKSARGVSLFWDLSTCKLFYELCG